MNGKQRIVLLLTAISMIIIILFLPFQFRGSTGAILNLGYGFLFDPPMYSGAYAGMANVGLLVVELFVAVLIGGMVTIIFKDGKL